MRDSFGAARGRYSFDVRYQYVAQDELWNGSSSTTLVREPVSRFTNVDFPTFGKPTTATVPFTPVESRRADGPARASSEGTPTAA